MNKHNFTERPSIEDCKEFDYVAIMGGMGDDTAMMIAEAYERGLHVDEIVFCDTGSEFPHTYKFIEDLKVWCEKTGFSKVVALRKLDRFDQPLSVISLCQDQNTLPSAAFGSKSCSLRFKAETADKYFNNNPDCWKAWGVEKKGVPLKTYTGKILRLVGLNADEPQRVARWRDEAKWVQAFPLYDWDIGEHESDAVERVGLYYPGKSSCTVCPNMSHAEIAMLRDDYPDKFQESLAIEAKFIEVNARKEDEIHYVSSFCHHDQLCADASAAVDSLNLRGQSLSVFKSTIEIHAYKNDPINVFDENGDFAGHREYDINDLISELLRWDAVEIKPKSTTQGLGRSKTWAAKLADYDANPKKYKRMSNNMPCECGK